MVSGHLACHCYRLARMSKDRTSPVAYIIWCLLDHRCPFNADHVLFFSTKYFCLLNARIFFFMSKHLFFSHFEVLSDLLNVVILHMYFCRVLYICYYTTKILFHQCLPKINFCQTHVFKNNEKDTKQPPRGNTIRIQLLQNCHATFNANRTSLW